MREVAGGLHRGGLRTLIARYEGSSLFGEVVPVSCFPHRPKKSWLTKQRARAPACSPPRSHPRDPPSRPRAVAMRAASISPRAAAPASFASRPSPSRPLALRKPTDDTTRGDLDVRAEAIVEEVERGGGDPTELLRRDVGRDVDTPEPARDSPATPSPSASVVGARRARARATETRPWRRSDHDPTAGSAFERPSAASDLAWERLAGDIEKVQDDAAIHYAKYEGAKRAPPPTEPPRRKARGGGEERGRTEGVERDHRRAAAGDRRARAAASHDGHVYEEARKWYEVFTGHQRITQAGAGTRQSQPTPKQCVCRCGSVHSGTEHMFTRSHRSLQVRCDPYLAAQRRTDYAPATYDAQEVLALHTTHPTPRSTT